MYKLTFIKTAKLRYIFSYYKDFNRDNLINPTITRVCTFFFFWEPDYIWTTIKWLLIIYHHNDWSDFHAFLKKWFLFLPLSKTKKKSEYQFKHNSIRIHQHPFFKGKRHYLKLYTIYKKKYTSLVNFSFGKQL